MQKAFIEHLLFPAMEQLKGNQIRSKLKALQATAAGGDLAGLQRESLIKLLLHCIHHVPAYQQLGITEEAIQKDPFAVLTQQVTPLTKSHFRMQPEAYLADSIDSAQRIGNSTGGSTGEPVHFFMTRDQVESYEAARWRGLSWYGITMGSRSAMLWGNPVELTAQQQRKQRMREQLLKNRRVLSAYDLSDEKIKEYVDFLNHYRPEYLYGYATVLSAVAESMERQQLSLRFPLKAVVSTAETLSDAQRALISRIFHCPVANEYGARDAGILAYTCPNGHLHITAENCIIEVLDPITLAPLPAGQTGVLAVTDLHNYVQPRLRYLLGDVGALSDADCDCPIKLPILSNVEGREDALLVGHNGVLMHGNLINKLLRPIPWVRAFQFRQHTPQSATLSIVIMPGMKADEQLLITKLQPHFPEATITVHFVDAIPPAASGKQRYAIREFPLPSSEAKQ